MGTEAIGWLSNLLLLMTMSKQVITQYKSGSTQGVSSWLFIGQLATSTGFVIYSYLLGNWVFVTSNVMLLFVAFTGQYLYLRNKRRQQASQPQDTASAAAAGPNRGVASSGKA